jgi:hypothetical protein
LAKKLKKAMLRAGEAVPEVLPAPQPTPEWMLPGGQA